MSNPFRPGSGQGQGQEQEGRLPRGAPPFPPRLVIPQQPQPGAPGLPPQQPPSHRGAPSLPPPPPFDAQQQRSYVDHAGGSFAQYTQHPQSPPLQAGAAPSYHQLGPAFGGAPQRPGPPLQQVSFQEPAGKKRPGMSTSGPSRDSVKSPGETTSGMASMPELGRDLEGGFSGANNNANFRRKKSLVRPDRERMDPNHRQWYYRNHAAQMDAVDSSGRAPAFSYMPSTTGHLPQHGAAPAGTPAYAYGAGMQGPGGGISGLGMMPPQPGTLGNLPSNVPPGGLGRVAPGGGLRRGKSILGRDEDQVESGINFLKRGVSLRRRSSQARKEGGGPNADDKRASVSGAPGSSKIAPGPVGPWMLYCYALTCCCPAPILRCFGIKKPEQQRAWREKIGVLSVVILAMGFVGFITFGFTRAVCGGSATRYEAGKIDSGSTVFHGYDYDFTSFYHPQVGPFAAGGPFARSNPAYSEPWLTGAKDGSPMFQVVGGKCTNFLRNAAGGGQPERYFDCGLFELNGRRGASNNTWCHTTSVTNNFLRPDNPLRKGEVSYSWESIADPTRNLAVWKGAVLDLNRLTAIYANISKPAIFATLTTRNATFAGKDVTASVFRAKQDDVFDCIEQVARVGFVDSQTIGCVAADVELYVSLVFIIGVVAIKFVMAVIFGWFLSWRLGNYAHETYEERKKRAEEIEKWSSDIYKPAPPSYRPNAKKHRSFLPKTSRFSTANMLTDAKTGRSPRTSEKGVGAGSRSPASRGGPRLGGFGSPLGSPPGSPSLRGVRSSTSLAHANRDASAYSHGGSRRSSFSNDVGFGMMGPCPFPLHNVVPQPPPDYQPFNFPLAHTICLVTAYSESFEGLRTTLDSLATTDYPNSHKILLVVADGIVKGAGSDISTPDICLSMMKDFVVPPEEVEGHSYVAIADGFKRHNMAKVYAGFYEYDDETVERSKQQRVPMILVAKCGTPLEAGSAKPGNRGKRDSQVLLMAFMQKVMFDERMTLFDYEFFNSIWRVTGVSPDHYEIVLMVDADTKVFPDSLSRMVACMVEDPEIMGLCGETKIANKKETWVTMIQVFEYYISHHQQKAFEACFGGVTCLPGCFSAYRIKAPKGPNGYWVPILANPDIVEHYSENVVDTLHKKNLLLLGEDRYLTTLMLKTFPKRKMMFVPQAVCKTIVPDTFRVLLSQRRRWINSTIHNLTELLFVNDLCGTFCFSMRFVIFMELAGTLVLPAAIAFTIYVATSAIYTRPIPVIPLVLLLIILGLPGLLIIVTSRKLSYVGWMGVYLVSLPIWNGIFPLYSFWHMDDFSWGETRKIVGETKGDNHGDAEGKFDPSNIVMKRWAEFERERRWKSGTHSRDSTFDVVQRTGSPERSGSTRYSVVSSDTFHSNPSAAQTDPSGRLLANASNALFDGSEAGHSKAGSSSGGARARLDTVPLLELPAPLGPEASSKGRGAAVAATGSVVIPRPRDHSPAANMAAMSPATSSSSQRPPFDPYPSNNSEPMDDEKRPMMGMTSPTGSPDPSMPPQHRSMSAVVADGVRHGNVASEQRYPGLTEAQFAQGLSAEPEDESSLSGGSSSHARPPREGQPRASRGFSLVDDGPVTSSQGPVRVVQRGGAAQRRNSNQAASPSQGPGARWSRAEK